MNRLALLIAVLSLAVSAHAVDMASITKAQVLLGQIDKVVEKYEEVQLLIDKGTLQLEADEPIADNSGKYMLPFDADGNLTAWAEKALTAQAGSQAGAMAGEKAAGALAAKVPFGGLASGFMKKKSKELGAVTAIGGWDFIKENTAQSFDSLYDYSVYMHARFNGMPGYQEALASAMAIYPDLETSHSRSVDKAYKSMRSDARRIAKEEAKAAKEAEKLAMEKARAEAEAAALASEQAEAEAEVDVEAVASDMAEEAGEG